LKVFIGGIMQGSRLDRHIGDQDYRQIISRTLLDRCTGIEIADPNQLHPGGVDYDDEAAKATLLAMAELAGQVDLVIVYLPEASMGTALEMCHAYQAGVPIVTISPMEANWVVRHLSSVVLPDLDSFRHWAVGGGLEALRVSPREG
jgi:saccharopine dehydrogenase-like NADP-dependent oxidoreductase